MTIHTLVGKLCQYRSEHRDKLLFTYDLTEQEKMEVAYSFRFFEDNINISSKTLIPTWFHLRYMEKFKIIDWPEPKTYHTPYFMTSLSNIRNVDTDSKIKTFLIIDSKTFHAGINGIRLYTRTLLKALLINNDVANTYWIDEEWIEPYGGCETYVEELKMKMLNKLRQNI